MVLVLISAIHVGQAADKPLKRLNLDGERTSNADLVALETLGELRYLSLNQTAVTDDGLVHLTRSTNLRSLSLNATAIGDQGLSHLAKIES